MYPRLLLLFSQSLLVFACIPKTDTESVACESSKQSVCKLKWHNLDRNFELSAIIERLNLV